MKKILILGANGDIGKYLVEYFLQQEGEDIFIVAAGRHDAFFRENNNFRYLKIDITNKNDFNQLPKDIYAVVDLAGMMPARMQGFYPEQYINTNIVGTLNVLEFCKFNSVDRIIYTQSFGDIKDYGDMYVELMPDMVPKYRYDTDHSVYVASKNTAVELIKCYHALFGLKGFIFRLPNIYVWSKNDSFYVDGKIKKIAWRHIVEQAEQGNDIEVWGDYTRVKDMIYVKDLCQMIYKSCFVNKEFGHYNAGTGIGVSLIDQIKGIIEVFSKEKQSKIVFKPEKPNAPQYIMNIDNAKKDLGYQPRYDYLEMLKDIKREKELDRF